MVQNTDAPTIDISPREQREIVETYSKLRELEAKLKRPDGETETLPNNLYSFLLQLMADLRAGQSVTILPSAAMARAEESSDARFKGQGVGAAVRQYMEIKKSATLDEIREALDRGGIEWGKYPKRQVALAIANSPKIYAVNGDTVTLNPSR